MLARVSHDSNRAIRCLTRVKRALPRRSSIAASHPARHETRFMATFDERRTAAAAQARRIVDQVLAIARSERGSATVAGGSKPHILITKQVSDFSDAYFRSMLSGIEYATHGHFAQGRDSGGMMEWMLRGRLIDVTVRCSKGLA